MAVLFDGLGFYRGEVVFALHSLNILNTFQDARRQSPILVLKRSRAFLATYLNRMSNAPRTTAKAP